MDMADVFEIIANNDNVCLADFVRPYYPHSDDEFETLSDEVTQNDIFLIYSAFRRYMHHCPRINKESKSRGEDFFRVYEDLDNWAKGFFEKASDMILNENKYLVRGDIKEQYDPEDTTLVNFNKYAENFQNLSDVVDAHIHGTEKHDPNYVWSSLFEKTSCFGDERSFKHYSFENYRHWMPASLKEAILTVRTSERVKWCVYLLFTYHYENECGLFVSCALKLCLRAFDLCEQAFRVYGFETFAKLMRYVYLIKECECDTQVLLSCLRVHCISHHIEDRLFKKPLHLKFILGKIQAGKAKIPGELISISPYFDPRLRYRQNADRFFLEDLDTFLTLLEFGVSTDFNAFIYCDIKEKIRISVAERRCFRELSLKESNTCRYRCVQLVYLYSCTPDLQSSEKDEALQILWASILDPFLTKLDMWLSFLVDGITTIPKDARRAWRWYDNIVAKGESRYRSPRSLQHLARCAIRHRLTSYFRLPIGVDSLMLPQKLKDYLLLKT